MKKECKLAFILILGAIILTAFVSAAEDDAIIKAYTCLENQLKDNCGGTSNTEQASLNLLAVSYDSKLQSDCKSALKNKKKETCWGDTDSSSCTLKSTALATIALKNIGENVDDSIKWILSKKEIKTNLKWFLEIDADNKTECDINGKKINIAENKKISGSDPTGLVKTYNNYWFEITNLNRNYTISCEKDFITTLLYQKPGSSVIHVSSQVHSTPAGDSITESVNSFCFATSSSCDYEGSLWATIALIKNGEDISSYLPYLSAMSEEALNKKYIPQAFLYMLTNEDDYYSELVKQQVQGKDGKYWDSSNRRLFDTSLAVLAIQNSNSQELDDAKAYLLSVQEKSGDKVGCWNDNTAFILYSAWPRDATKSTTTNTESTNCESFNHYCVPSLQCSSVNVLVNFNCPGLNGDVCCKTQAPLEETCSQKNGVVCNQNEKCSGSEVPAQDTNFCCTNGACEAAEQTNSCEDSNYNCRTSCLSTEVEKTELSQACGFDKCCAAKPASQTNWLLIILLVILIILVVLAIVFRNQLRIWMFKTKSGFGYGKPSAPGTRPLPPPGFRPIFPPRPAPAHLYQTQQRRAPGRPEKDKDFEDTMRKLRDMSK